MILKQYPICRQSSNKNKIARHVIFGLAIWLLGDPITKAGVSGSITTSSTVGLYIFTSGGQYGYYDQQVHGTNGAILPENSLGGPYPSAYTYPSNQQGISYSTNATASIGQAQLHSSAQVSMNDPAIGLSGAARGADTFLRTDSTVTMIVDDVTFHRSFGSLPTSVNASLTLDLDGTLDAVAPAGEAYLPGKNFFNASSVAGVNLTVRTNGFSQFGTASLSRDSAGADDLTTGGILKPIHAGFGGYRLSIPIGLNDVDEAINITIILETDASLDYANAPNSGSAISDFGRTLTFPTDGTPVFTLPDGYTADSPGAHIVDNVFQVPEPSSLFLTASAISVIACRRRRR